MVHNIGRIECIPGVINQHIRFNDTFFDQLLNFPDFLDIPVMPVVKSVIVVMKVIRVEWFELLSPLISLIGLTRTCQIKCELFFHSHLVELFD